MRKYLIVPCCSDLNRGDQALSWETRKIAEEAGFIGQYYMTAERNEPVDQSKGKGFDIVYPLLEHPSRKFKNKDNIIYSRTLKIKWGVVALFDLVFSFFLLFKYARNILKKIVTPEKRRSIELFEDADAIFMKGGGLLQTYGGISSSYSMYFWVYPLLLAHRMKKDVYIMPNSFGPFRGLFVKKIAYKALKSCKFISARESYSQNALDKILGISAGNYADLAFELPSAVMDKDSVIFKFGLPLDKKLVALTMRPYRFPKSKNSDKAYLDFKQSFSIFIEWLYSKGLFPVIVEHTLAVNSHENDGACIKDVVKNLNKEHYRIISDDNYDCEDLKAIYGMFQYIVGTRFHSMIFSFGCNVPGIAISYVGNKSTGIMHDMDLDDFVIDIYSVNSDVLINKFELLLSLENEVKMKIFNYQKKAELSNKKLVEELKKLRK